MQLLHDYRSCMICLGLLTRAPCVVLSCTFRPPELVSLLSVPCQPEAVAYSLRLRVHNGRGFVGPGVTAQLQVGAECICCT